MKHAGPRALDQLGDLLAALRSLPGLVEKTPGAFYRRSRAFLHFHEDPAGLFADIRQVEGSDFDRLEVTGPAGREALLAAVRERLQA